ncbi:hypothetical protein ABK046_51800, partial [Streptomyces caeruleatus]
MSLLLIIMLFLILASYLAIANSLATGTTANATAVFRRVQASMFSVYFIGGVIFVSFWFMINV